MNTVFIVGAGASFDYGFPVGKTLQAEIVSFLSRNHATETGLNNAIEYSLSKIEKMGHSFDDTLNTCDWMSKSLMLSPSIDSFLENQSSEGDLISYLGKLAISSIIGLREHSSKLSRFDKEYEQSTELASTWLGKAWNALNRGGRARPTDCPLPNTSFVTFNYDRCIEHFLHRAINLFYRTPEQESVNLLKSIPVVHVYGSLGDITSNDHSDRFGARSHPHQFTDIADRIKTYSEQVDSAVSDQIRNIIEESDRIIFLGFSFGKINRQFLQSISRPKMSRNTFGSAYGMSDQDTTTASQWAHGRFSGNSNMKFLTSCKADEFFDRNSMIF